MSEILKAVQISCQRAVTAIQDVSARAPGSTSTQALVVGALAGFLAYRLMKKRYHLPPGPRALPMLGNLLLMNSWKEHFYVMLQRLAREKYGPVVSIYFGPVLCVTLNDLDSVNEALVQKGNDFSGRPSFHSWDKLTEEGNDIAFVDPSPFWKFLRKIAIKAIRHYMMGSHLEKVVQEVVVKVGDQMAAEPAPFDTHPYNNRLMFNIIHCNCFGEVKPLDDPSLQRLIDLFEEIYQHMASGFFEDIIPLLKFFPTRRFQRVVDIEYEIFNYFESHIQKHRESFSPEKILDVTNSLLLAEMQAAQEESSEVMAKFKDVHVRQIVGDLFTAGVDTSRVTLDWIMLYLAAYPQMQTRMQAEIDAATGSEMPGLADRSRLPYTQAVLYEIMRLDGVSPTGLPHKTMCDTTVHGYDVPKGTLVIVNLWAVMHDPQQWDNPQELMPERFLDEHGRCSGIQNNP